LQTNVLNHDSVNIFVICWFR